ncbi:MAG: hypothetical protein Tsb0034_16280 [Ekhidna sp.]
MRIEELIKNRKDRLDVETPPDDVWGEIRKEWQPKKKDVFPWWKAAAILFITLSAVLATYTLSLRSQVEELASLGDLSSEYQELEASYISQVNLLESAIPIGDIRADEDYRWLFEELETLDSINMIYRADIGKVNEEELVGVLIDYYEKKLKLLRKLELEIERTRKIKEDEKNNSDNMRI